MSARAVVMEVSVPQLLATIEMMKVQYPGGEDCNVALTFGESTDVERDAMGRKLLEGLVMASMTSGLIAVFTAGMLVQREMERAARFDAEMVAATERE